MPRNQVVNIPGISTEPRNGVFLTDKTNEKIAENKEILTEAIGLYTTILIYAVKNSWKGLYHLARVAAPPAKDWLSASWYTEGVLEPLREILSHAAIVETDTGDFEPMLSAEDTPVMWFPYSAKKEVREMIWKLSNKWIPTVLPALKDIHHWYPLLWGQCGKLTLKEITQDLHGYGSLAELETKLKQATAIDWLNEYYDLLNYEGKVIDEVISEKYYVLPNQNGEFKKMTELSFDSEIPEQLKDILLSLGEDIRNKLRDNNVFSLNKYNKDADNQIKHSSRKPDSIVAKINKFLSNADNDDEVLDAALGMAGLFPVNDPKNQKRTEVLEFSKRIFTSFLFFPTTISYNDPSIWLEADKLINRKIVTTIAGCGTINDFSTTYGFDSVKKALSWLNDFITYLIAASDDHYLNEEETAILPNQNGDFVIRDMLFLDDDTIDEKLKDIAESLEYFVRTDLLDKQIFLELPDNLVLSDKLVAEKITSLVLPKLAELPREESTKQTFRLIYLWFRDHAQRATLIFRELYLNRHKLYDDDEVADNMEKAENLKQLLEDFDITNIEQLREIISAKRQHQEQEPDATPITRETLASLGIGSLAELEVALQDVNLAKVFLHNVTPTVEMFEYALGLRERARHNVLAYLKTLNEYDCDEAEQTAPTVWGGIKYNGYDINVVTRPSDNREVIFYYSSEKDVLELPESQLWIDDGRTTPRLLTLGAILKITGITKIPV